MIRAFPRAASNAFGRVFQTITNEKLMLYIYFEHRPIAIESKYKVVVAVEFEGGSTGVYFVN